MSFDRARSTSARADQTTVRRANLGVVLQHVARSGARSRARIAAETGLTRGTVSSLVSELIDLDLLRGTGEDERPGGVGRPAQTLELHDRVVAVGLEVNVDYLAVCVEDLTGTVRWERRVYADNRGSAPGPVLDRLARAATAALVAARAAGQRPAGVSVAVPGLVEVVSRTIVFAPNLGWTDVPIGDELARRLGLAVEVENEANLAALAEHWSGAARDLDDFLCVFGEVGVGGGIVVAGKLHRGAHGFGGEFGHMVVDRGGALCACGGRGCLETVVGQDAIAQAAGIEPTSGRTRSLTDEIVRRAEAGDARALAALGEAGRCLGSALVSAVNLLDLQAVVLGGCFGPLAPWLSGEVALALREQPIAARAATVSVVPSAFGEGAAVRGAAALILRRVLDAPWTAPSGHVPSDVAI
ncbi:MAG: ROK family protein [Gaiellaceae bacterium]